jgi:hypothetical protein
MTNSAGDRWTFRLFLLFLFPPIIFIGVASSYYILESTKWSQMDQPLAIAMRLFYIYAPLSSICLLAALIWLVIDERKLRRLTQQSEEKKGESN